MEREHRCHIPNRLRKHRKLNGYTQKQVATLLGVVGTDRISQWENGLKYPNVVNLIKLSLIYHVLPTDLYYDVMKTLQAELKARTQSSEVLDIDAS